MQLSQRILFLGPRLSNYLEDLRYSSMVPASETSKGSGPYSWLTPPPSMKSFSTFISLITAEYLQDLSPNPRSASQVADIPIPRVKRQAPSGMSLTFSNPLDPTVLSSVSL